jgi:DNA-binding NarL/FixJ family response regulator
MGVNGHPRDRAGKGKGSEPTPREWVILLEIEKGQSNPTIARKLCLSPNTVKTHAQRAFGKLGVDNRTQAALLVRALRESGKYPPVE